MDIKLLDNQKQWDELAAGQTKAQFLQSWAWGEFQKSVGRRVWRVGWLENDKPVGLAQILEHYLGLGWAYLYCPRGPISISNDPLKISNLTDFIKKEAANYGELFLRVEPPASAAILNIKQANRVRSVQPAHTLMVDLSKSEDELLADMHQKTRYNIRLAEKKNLIFRVKNQKSKTDEADFDKFWKLLKQTSRRDDIKLHPKTYYQKMLAIAPSLILTVEYDGQWLAAGLFIGFGDTFTYVHGTSGNIHRELMAPYLLQWQAIKLAKAAGYCYYDFGGINPEDTREFDYRNRWTGLTRFKKGFGGLIHSYPGTFDLPINRLGYKLYNVIKKVL